MGELGRFDRKTCRILLFSLLWLANAAVIFLIGPASYPLIAFYVLGIIFAWKQWGAVAASFACVTADLFFALAALAGQSWRFGRGWFTAAAFTGVGLAGAMGYGLVAHRKDRELHGRLLETVNSLAEVRDDQSRQLRQLTRANMSLEERYAETYTLYLIQQEIIAELDAEKTLPKVADIILGLLGGKSCSIVLAKAEPFSMRFAAFAGGGGEDPAMLSLEGVLARSCLKNMVLTHQDLSTSEMVFWRNRRVNGFLCVPIPVKDDFTGVILIEYDYLPASLKDHQQLLTMVAGQISLALESTRLYQRVNQMAMHDALTGVWNRHYFQERLDAELAAAGEQRPLSIVILDIDHFKKVNDKYGHGTGDEVLRQLAVLLHGKLGEQTPIARYGGEEFVVLMPGTDLRTALTRAEEIRGWVAAHTCVCGDIRLKITVSLGVATYPECVKDPGRLMEQADEGLYTAKSRGRNRVVGAGASASFFE